MKRTKNCQCCLASYSPYSPEKDITTDEWCVLPLTDETGKILEPKGLCEFCHPKAYCYGPELRCHNRESIPTDMPCPEHIFIEFPVGTNIYAEGVCTLCGTSKIVYERWKAEGRDYRGHNFLFPPLDPPKIRQVGNITIIG